MPHVGHISNEEMPSGQGSKSRLEAQTGHDATGTLFPTRALRGIRLHLLSKLTGLGVVPRREISVPTIHVRDSAEMHSQILERVGQRSNERLRCLVVDRCAYDVRRLPPKASTVIKKVWKVEEIGD